VTGGLNPERFYENDFTARDSCIPPREMSPSVQEISMEQDACYHRFAPSLSRLAVSSVTVVRPFVRVQRKIEDTPPATEGNLRFLWLWRPASVRGRISAL